MNEIDTPSEAPASPDEDVDYDYTPQADPALAQPQVSSYIAIIRIVSVLAMGLCVSGGLFLVLIGSREALITGVLLIVAAIPCYYGMQLAERLASREQRDSAAES
jgi:hypothetical protein